MSILKKDNAISMRYFTSKAKKSVYDDGRESIQQLLHRICQIHRRLPLSSMWPKFLSCFIYIKMIYMHYFYFIYIFISYLHVCHSDDSNWKIIHVNSNTLSRHWQFLRKNYLFLRKFRFIEISFEKMLQGKNYFLVRKNINLIWNTFNWISIFKGEYFIFQVWQNIKHCK